MDDYHEKELQHRFTYEKLTGKNSHDHDGKNSHDHVKSPEMKDLELLEIT